MTPTTPAFDGLVMAALEQSPSRIPVILGPCGAGRTSILHRIRKHLGESACQYVALEQVVSTPERFLNALTGQSPFGWVPGGTGADGPEAAYRGVRECFDQARAPGGAPATFLLDEALELRGFENFPGLRRVMADTLSSLADSPNRFVLTSRFVSRALTLLGNGSDRFVVMHAPAVSGPALAADLLRLPGVRLDTAEDFSRVIVALSDGRVAYAYAIVGALGQAGVCAEDPVSAFAALLSPGGALAIRCRDSYEFRLYRARGYGALKAILGILSEEEPLTLTEISQRMHRTPGSTKDYIGWLENVDLVAVHRKRYSFADPVLRLWVRLHTACDAPNDDRVSEEVQRYALTRLSGSEPRDTTS
jgi:hypothetical protein